MDGQVKAKEKHKHRGHPLQDRLVVKVSIGIGRQIVRIEVCSLDVREDQGAESVPAHDHAVDESLLFGKPLDGMERRAC